jgi:hypothetical protein
MRWLPKLHDTSLRERALKRLRKKREFAGHLPAYVAVNGFIIRIWAVTSELCDIAKDAELDKALFEVVGDCQSSAADAARAMGFVTAAAIEGGARDIDGHLHNVSILAMPLGKYHEWCTY